MNTKDGYAKKSLTSARLLTADGGDTDNYLPLTGGTMTGALATTALSVAGAATFSQAINGNILGNAATASRLLNARTISLTGSITGSGIFDGSGNLSIDTTTNHTHDDYLPLTGGNITTVDGLTVANSRVLTVEDEKWWDTIIYNNSSSSGSGLYSVSQLISNSDIHVVSSFVAPRMGILYSKQTFLDGYVTFTIMQASLSSGGSIYIGFGQVSNNNTSSIILLRFSSSTLLCQYNGTLIGIGYTWTSSDVFTIAFRNGKCYFYINGVLQCEGQIDNVARSLIIFTSVTCEVIIKNFGSFPNPGLGLSDLTNVVITLPSTGQVLKYNGTNWVNDTDNTIEGGGGYASNVLTSLTSNILYGSTSGNAGIYQPYAASTATTTWIANDDNAGRLYLGTNNPTKTTRLNYNGYLYATKLYSGGIEVSVDDRSDTNTTYLASTNITITNIGESNFLDCNIIGDIIVNSAFTIITLNQEEPTSGTIIRVTVSALCTATNNTRLVFKFNNSNNLWSAMNTSNSSSNLKWYILKKSPFFSGINYFFKLRTQNSNRFADFLGTDIKYISSTSGALGDLSNVSLTSPTNGLVLKFDGTNWVNGTDEGSTVTLPSSNITLSKSNQTYITVGSTARKIKLPSTCPWSISLSNLSDTSISSLSSGLYLKYNGTNWVNASLPKAKSWAESGAGTLGISSPTLSIDKAVAAEGASVTSTPQALYYPGNDQYYALPVIIDSDGQLFVAISPTLASFVSGDKWSSISPK